MALNRCFLDRASISQLKLDTKIACLILRCHAIQYCKVLNCHSANDSKEEYNKAIDDNAIITVTFSKLLIILKLKYTRMALFSSHHYIELDSKYAFNRYSELKLTPCMPQCLTYMIIWYLVWSKGPQESHWLRKYGQSYSFARNRKSPNDKCYQTFFAHNFRFA